MLGACDRQDGAKGQDGVSADKPAATTQDMGAFEISRTRKGMPFPAANFTAPDDGIEKPAPVSLAKWRGTPVVLNLWATWCIPCKVEMPTLDALATKNDRKFAVVAVSQDTKDTDKVLAYFTDAKFAALEPYTDTENTLLMASGGGGLPLTILIDAKGRELLRVTGPLDWSGKEASVLIAEMLQSGN